MGTLLIPGRVTVAEVIESRYSKNKKVPAKPNSWDQRKEGVDTVKLSDGSSVKLLSDGGQSVPQAGWVLLLTSGDPQSGYRWTLFGLPKGTEAFAW